MRTTDGVEPSNGLRWSLLGHVLLLALGLMKGLLFPSTAHRYIPTLKVDLVGLPDILQKNQPRPLPNEKAEKAQKQKEFNQEILKILKNAEQDALRIKNTQAPPAKNEMALKNIQKPIPQTPSKSIENRNRNLLKRFQSLHKIRESTSQPTASKPILGNKLSAGESQAADAREGSEANYLGLIRDRLKENWNLPIWLQRQKLSAQVRILLSTTGNLQDIAFDHHSNNPAFDEEVKRTIRESAPFPHPPHDLQRIASSPGIPFSFDSESVIVSSP